MLSLTSFSAINKVTAEIPQQDFADILNNFDKLKRFWLVLVGLGAFGLISFIADIQQISQASVSFIKNIRNWWMSTLPAQKLLGPISKDKNKVAIFVRDLFIATGTPIFSREGASGPVGTVPNVLELWPRVEASSLARLLNTLGQANKTKNIEIIEMGKDTGIWNCNLMVLGAQTQKCFDFYQRMNEVAYRVDRNNILNNITGKAVRRAPDFGYGIILKCKNPFVSGGKGVAFLLGGYGVLGTEAAVYYFTQNIAKLGKEFGSSSFGLIVRASVTAGVQSTRRLKRYDKKF